MLCWPQLLLPALCWILFTYLTSAQVNECQERCNLYHGHCDEEGVCRCDPGWNGKFCDDCVRMPGCVHGSCHQPWQCMCHLGWAGKFCDRDIYVCEHSHPCLNEAECLIEADGEYSCLCPDPFHGKNCEFKRGPCELARLPCLNGGTCQDENGYADTFTCRCLAGYVGRFCEIDVDDCLMRPCANGATCHDGVNRFSCECPLGFQGRFCTVNINDCASNPCQNGGRCFDRVGDYECFCPEGLIGKSCEIPLPRPTMNTDQGTSTIDQAPTRPYPQVTQTDRTGGTSQGAAGISQDGGDSFKIPVKEVFTQKEYGLSKVQMIIVTVFGGITVVLILLTITVLLWYRNRGARLASCCRDSSPAPKTHYHECQDTSTDHRKTTTTF